MKHAFTLIEIIISIAIFAIISLYMYQAINSAKNGNDIYLKRLNDAQKEHNIIRLFYNDIFSQTNIYAPANITTDAEFDTFYIHTRNSIHAMINPYVAYFVNKNSLYRIESKNFEAIPLSYDGLESVKVDKILDNVTLFRIYESKNSYFINYKSEDESKSFQISLPQRASSSGTNNSNSSKK